MNPIQWYGGLLGKVDKMKQDAMIDRVKTANPGIEGVELEKAIQAAQSRVNARSEKTNEMGNNWVHQNAQVPDMSQVGMMAMQGMPSPMQIMQMNQREQMRKQPFRIQTTKMRPTSGGMK